ncbi:glycoside hydrolase [Sunxiuqinia elliptica]|uniref:glycoside hydrolase n=1 Tax=Sunxiuqinia elliptica TaxID=655355 RepID=UPI00105BEA9E|nr:glycoside hydrolase [Sunxiuqinia elliptica]
MNRPKIIIGGVWLLVLLLTGFGGLASEPDELSLKGWWKFRIGDNEEWSSTTYNDANWQEIEVPARWEDEGFRGYDGYAWYRKTVYLGTELKNKNLILELGYIDDVDEVFINGVKIGQSGAFPPRFATAYNAKRTYQIPPDVIQVGQENSIAVRVYDALLEGGIVSGNIRIYSEGTLPPFSINLTGTWMFNKGRSFDPNNYDEIQVPAVWEDQGYNDYDGYAVYTRRLRISETLASERLILLAGKIDDADRLYINGELIGGTGEYDRRYDRGLYNEFRNYFIPPGMLKAGEENILEIRVNDIGGFGGIYEGPVGIMTLDQFRKYWQLKRRN